ncbi:GIDE domain-containing protein, partial [Pseudomonadota bacterium]
ASQRSWQLVEQGESSAGFLVDDGSGRCLVKPDGAEFNHLTDLTWYSDEKPPTGLPTAYKMPLGGKYKYKEKLIFPNEKVYCLGAFSTDAESCSSSIAAEPDHSIKGTIVSPGISQPFIITMGVSQREMALAYLDRGRLARFGMLCIAGMAGWWLYQQ